MMFVVLLLLAIVPAMIASKKGRNAGLWWLYGVLLLPIAVVHSLLAENRLRHPCPHCAEPIQREAAICPHCRSELSSRAMQGERPHSPPARAISAIGLVVLVLLAIPMWISIQHRPDASKTTETETTSKPQQQTQQTGQSSSWAPAGSAAVMSCPPSHWMTSDGCKRY
jgi:hypothetical protein